MFGVPALAQSPSENPPPPFRPQPIPLSGRPPQQGDVTVMQQTTPNGGGSNGDSTNIIQSTVTVMPPYSGSAAAGKATGDVMLLTLDQALKMGLHENLGALAQSAAVQQAQGQRAIARSELLPQLNTTVSEVYEKLNLRTEGLKIASIPEATKFNYFDARALRLQESVFDLARLRNLHSATQTVDAAMKSARNARDLVVLAVGGSYLELVSIRARIEATAAQVDTSRAILQQASDRLDAGLAPRIDVTRSKVQLQTEQQTQRSLDADLETQQLKLARIIGLPLGQAFVTDGAYPFTPMADLPVETALQKAYAARPDLQAASAALKAAEDAERAAHAERYPTLSVLGDFGAAGTTPTNHALGVFNVSGTLNIPIYQGGRVAGDVSVASAAVKQRKAELEDIRGQIDQDVRQAFIALRASADQVALARSNVELAHETLTYSRDRFIAGIADTVEVVQAEQSVVQADDEYISAVFENNLGKVSLARAMGDAEQTLPQLLRNP